MTSISDEVIQMLRDSGMSEEQANQVATAAEMVVGEDGQLLVKPWRLTAEAARKALMEEQVSTALGGAWETDEETEDATWDAMENAVPLLEQGRLIWLDEVPPLDVLERECDRGQQMFLDGFIRHPFVDGYVLAFNDSGFDREFPDAAKEFPEVFSELGITGTSSGHVLVVSPWGHGGDDDGPPAVGVFAFSASEIQGEKFLTPAVEFTFRMTKKGLMVNDIDENALEGPQLLATRHLRHRCSSMLFYALMVLNTEFVPIEDVPPPVKLNRQRVKNGKPPLPGFTKVHTEDYITALTGKTRARSKDAKVGTHASPVTHLRRGHRRWLDAEHTRSTWVRDSLVNVRKMVFGDRARSFYDASQLH